MNRTTDVLAAGQVPFPTFGFALGGYGRGGMPSGLEERRDGAPSVKEQRGAMRKQIARCVCG